MNFSTIKQAIADIADGKMLIVVDDEQRENEGDLLMAAQCITTEQVNFMSRYGRGLICAPMSESVAHKLNLPLMVTENNDRHGTAFTISVDAKVSTTGISAAERAETLRMLAAATTQQSDLRRPGHIFPLIAKDGGVLVRPGHTEAAVDLTNLAGMAPVGVICEIMNEDGTMARLPQLQVFAEQHNLNIISIAELQRYRKRYNKILQRVACAQAPTKFGNFVLYGYQHYCSDEHHLALVMGEPGKWRQPVLTRVHSECLTGDVFHSLRCDCGEQLQQALNNIAAAGSGVLIYLRQEGRGIGLINKLKAYELQEKGHDTVEANLQLGFAADMRDYSLAAEILRDLQISSVRLMTNNPQKIKDLKHYGISIAEHVPLQIAANKINRRYLYTKRKKFGHILLDI